MQPFAMFLINYIPEPPLRASPQPIHRLERAPPGNGAVSPSVLLGQAPDAKKFRQSLWRHVHFPEFRGGGKTKRTPGGAQQSKPSSQKLQQARQHGSPARSGCIR